MPLLSFNDHLASIMQWHFSSDTGSPFWLAMKEQLNFDPIKDIRSFEDLALFPDVSLTLREVPVEELQPKGLKGQPVTGIFESGGTTGKAKRIVLYEAWLNQLVDWRMQSFNFSHADGRPRNTLAIIPTGPHLVGAINRRRAKALGGECFTVDLDPRWVKKLIQRGDVAGVGVYIGHLLDQAEPIITTQSISYLVTTPPLLEAIAQRRPLAKYLNETLEMILWGGTHMDINTLDYLKTAVFPDVTITASYGSTMILSETKARFGEDHQGAPIFDSFAPYVALEVVNPTSRQPVNYFERGQVLMHHISQFALFPNILERDSAVRLPSSGKYPGVAVCDIKPMVGISEEAIIEGVY